MARQQQDVDELFDVKNAFYFGNYQQAINEAQTINTNDPTTRLQRDAFLYRAYIAQGNYRIVLQELNNANSLLLPLKSLVDYLSPGANKNEIVADIDARVAKGTELQNEIFLIAASTIYYHEDNYEAALKILHGAASLELKATALQCLLAMNRPDLARRQLRAMQEAEDDATLTQLAGAWLALSEGGGALRDALHALQELGERLGAGGAARAAALGALGRWPQAEEALAAAQALAPRDPDLLLGLAVASAHAGRPSEVASRFLAQLQESHPWHRFARDLALKSEEFRRLSAQFRPSAEA